MSTARYISSGILEKHFLGLITPEEKEELDQVLSLYPELVTEMEEVERRLEKMLMDRPIAPPEEIRRKFLEKVWMQEQLFAEHERGFAEYEQVFVEHEQSFVEPPPGKITVHVGFRIFFIFYLVTVLLGVLAWVLYFFKK